MSFFFPVLKLKEAQLCLSQGWIFIVGFCWCCADGRNRCSLQQVSVFRIFSHDNANKVMVWVDDCLFWQRWGSAVSVDTHLLASAEYMRHDNTRKESDFTVVYLQRDSGLQETFQLQPATGKFWMLLSCITLYSYNTETNFIWMRKQHALS